MRCSSLLGLLAIGVCLSAASGCQSMKPGKLSSVQPTSESPRAGNAYLLRGFIGVFSSGIDQLTAKLNHKGVRAHVFQDDQWKVLAERIRRQYRDEIDHEPIVLIGHSYGADDVVRIARRLAEDGIQVDLVVTIDPVTPPKVPENVKTAVNIFRSNGAMDALPWLRGVRVSAESGDTVLANYDIRERVDLLEPGTDHFNIEKKDSIHQEVIRQALAACPPRQVWAAGRAGRGVELVRSGNPTRHLSVVEEGGGDTQPRR